VVNSLQSRIWHESRSFVPYIGMGVNAARHTDSAKIPFDLTIQLTAFCRYMSARDDMEGEH